MNSEKRFALLIDAENVSAQYAMYIMDEVDNYGICSYKRIYGSWDKIVKTKWEGEINKNSLKPMMQFNNTRGKNATDSALIIDAMDILYRGNVEGFCIVSSDSDFTYLARRLMESGVTVIGMGESDKATEALENAYDKYIYIDLVAKQAEQEEETKLAAERAEKANERRQADAEGKTPSKKVIEAKIQQIIKNNDDKSKNTDLAQVGNELNRTYKNFDVRYYSRKGGEKYRYLKDFVSDFKSLELVRDEKSICVRIK